MSAGGRGDGRRRLLAAATRLVREQGFAATSVEAICREACVTKGAFFHHFPSKEALGVAAAENWSDMTGRLFAEAPYHEPADPLDRVLAYIDFRRSLVAGEVADYTCLVGTIVQEAHGCDAVRAACAASIYGHARTLEADLAEAMQARGVTGVDPAGLARHMQAVLQGSFILAKAGGGQAAVSEALDHLRRYVCLMFSIPGRSGA
ncbi:TetR/AcrR family transcriptional regulator [Rhodobacter sp. NSM]|uniref:TetR/AcrR family transcriptional regulator n=1 Tax=Rhodobacter sp. NSM TaxID=3457501 RepID=UPI003FD3EAB9